MADTLGASFLQLASGVAKGAAVAEEQKQKREQSELIKALTEQQTRSAEIRNEAALQQIEESRLKIDDTRRKLIRRETAEAFAEGPGRFNRFLTDYEDASQALGQFLGASKINSVNVFNPEDETHQNLRKQRGRDGEPDADLWVVNTPEGQMVVNKNLAAAQMGVAGDVKKLQLQQRAEEATVRKAEVGVEKIEKEIAEGITGNIGTDEAFLRRLNKEGRISEEKFNELMLELASKKTQPNLNSIQKNLETEMRETATALDFVNNLEGANFTPSQLSEIDTRDLDVKSKAKLDRLSNILVQTQKPKAAEAISKKMLDINTFRNQIRDALRITVKDISRGKDVNAIDKTIRDNISKYIGLSEEENVAAFRDSRFQSAANTLLKVMSGAAVTGNEFERFKQATATLFQTNEAVINGMLSMAEDQLSQLEGARAVLGADIFNLKFGAIQRGLQDLKDGLTEAQAQQTGGELPGEAEAPAAEFTPIGGDTGRTVVERRRTRDGRTIVKFSDGTFGVE